MNLTDDFVLKCLKGGAVLIEDICAVYSLTLGEIVDYGYDNFLHSLQILTLTKPVFNKGNDMAKLFEALSDYQYFLALTTLDAEFLEQAKKAFRFFTKENVIFSIDTEQIIIGPPEEKHILSEEYFYELQKILKKMYNLDDDEEEIVISPNDSPQVQNMKRQMIMNRKKAKQSKKVGKGGKNDLSFSDLVASVAAGNIGLNIVNIWDITYYAFHDQLKRMEWREQFDINNRAAMAGAKLKPNQLKHWIKSIHSKDK